MAQLGRLLTPMVTPFRPDESIDFEAAKRLAQILVADGSDGIVVAGTTGEAATMTDEEKIELVRQIKAAIPGKTVVAGTGGNDTRHSVALSRAACEAGADAVLCVVPYYNKPTQEGIYRHYRAIAEGCGGPVIMYNIESRSAVNMTAATTIRCAAVPGVVGVKEASGSLPQVSQICADAPPGFQVWAGDDALTLPVLAVGGHGVICVVSHLAGTAIREIIEAFARGDNRRAAQIHQRLTPLMRSLMTAAPNPIPIKSVLNRLGFPAGQFRLPLAPMPEPDLDQLMAVVKSAGDLVTFSTAVGV